MALTAKKTLLQVPLIVGVNIIEPFDITNHVGFSITIKGPTGAAGTATLQMSNTNNSAVTADWTTVPTTIMATGALVSNGSVTVSSINGLRAAFVRASINVTAGAGNYDIYYVAKEC